MGRVYREPLTNKSKALSDTATPSNGPGRLGIYVRIWEEFTIKKIAFGFSYLEYQDVLEVILCDKGISTVHMCTVVCANIG